MFKFYHNNQEYIGRPTEDGSHMQVFKDDLFVRLFGPEQVQNTRMSLFCKYDETLIGACMNAYAEEVDGQN